VSQFFKELKWYPPAETKIQLSSIFSAFFPSDSDFAIKFCNYLNVDKCVLGNSGRALLALLLKALHEKDESQRDEVLIPGYTCYSVAASVVRAGLNIGVYDLNPSTLEPDLDSIIKAVGSKTLAIIVQHLCGIPIPVEDTKRIAKTNHAYVIEDAAQALGGGLSGQHCGTTGDFGFFSFGRGKPLPLGGGGAVIGKDPEIFSDLRLKSNGKGYAKLIQTAATQLMSMHCLYHIPEMLPLGLGETVFDPSFLVSGMPMLMQNLAANSISTLDDVNSHRRQIAGIYGEILDDDCIFSAIEEARPVYTRFPIIAAQDLISKELKRLGVRRMYPEAIVDEGTIKPYLCAQVEATPGSRFIAKNLITLPTHLGISEKLAVKIARLINENCQRM